MKLLTHTEWLKPIFCLALGFFTCLGLIPLILQWAEYHGGTNHGRDFHHAHSPSVVRLGGAALAVAFAAVALAIPRFGSLSAAGMNTLGVIVFSSLAMFSLGFWDDLRPLGSRFASHVSGFTKNWSEIGSQLRNSLTLRKETRYALLLSQWMEVEVERRRSVQELWQDYQFVIKKLGFSRVKLEMRNGAHTWQAEGFGVSTGEFQHVCHQFIDGSVIEFSADQRVLPEHLFKLLADLAAETWHKAASRWRVLNKTPFQSMSSATLPEFSSQRKFIRFYTPVGR